MSAVSEMNAVRAVRTLAYDVFLRGVSMIVTTNNWDTSWLDWRDADWVDKNCVVVAVTTPVWEEGAASSGG